MATCRYCAYLRKCIEKATKEGYEHNVDFDAEKGCPNFGFKSNTNADRIRAMSDEELVGYLIQYRDDWGDYVTPNCEFFDTYEEAEVETIKWLKQPAEKGE